MLSDHLGWSIRERPNITEAFLCNSIFKDQSSKFQEKSIFQASIFNGCKIREPATTRSASALPTV